LLIILLLACTLLIDKKAAVPNRQLLIYGTIFMAAALAMNIKFTGVVYGAIIIGCYWLYLAVRKNWSLLIRLSIVGVATMLFGILVIGTSSYVKNFHTNGNPLYPLAGKGSIDFITPLEPAGYEHESNLRKFIDANLSRTGIESRESTLLHGDPPRKVPFSITFEELNLLHGVDIKQAGYGPWFGGILILSCGMGIYLLIRYGRRYQKQLPLFLIPLATLGIAIVGVDATWWARYLPYLPIFPVIVIVALYIRKETVLPNILAFALLFNVTLMTVVSLNNQSRVLDLADQTFAQLKPCNTKQPLYVYSTIRLDGTLYNLHDRCSNVTPITLKAFKTVPDKDKVMLYNSIYLVTNKNFKP
jgi:hypothetical protein